MQVSDILMIMLKLLLDPFLNFCRQWAQFKIFVHVVFLIKSLAKKVEWKLCLGEWRPFILFIWGKWIFHWSFDCLEKKSLSLVHVTSSHTNTFLKDFYRVW
jgi:hypothetical protein